MKIVFHENFFNSYTSDPAAAKGRLEPIIAELKKFKDYEFITPKPAQKNDILLAHPLDHFNRIQNSQNIFKMALLAAGGAIKAAELAYDGMPTFGCIRPPGHHASANSCWGFCFFNNISVSLLKLNFDKKIKSAFVLDFDLHTGDGNINILTVKRDKLQTEILNPTGYSEVEYLEEIENEFNGAPKFDIITASAGFDEYILDWGGKLSTKAYNKIGKLMKDFSEDKCNGRRYALLEGGYYFEDLGKNVHSFCEGFK
ncbi:MAG: histone deacetylase family protein [Candidatus Helarchaeota archaeon]